MSVHRDVSQGNAILEGPFLREIPFFVKRKPSHRDEIYFQIGEISSTFLFLFVFYQSWMISTELSTL